MKVEKISIMLKHFPKDLDLDLAFVIFFTLLCIQTFLWKRKLYQRNGETFSWKEKVYQKKELLEKFKDFLLAQVFFCKKKKCFGIRLSPVLIVLSVFTVSLALGAYVRRSMIPEENRFAVDFAAFFKSLKKSFKTTDTKIDRVLTVILIISIVLAISMTVYVIVTPKEGEKFTEFYVLGPNGTASDYPTNIKVGEEGEVIIGIVNHEYANVTYQLEVRLNGTVIGEKSIELMHNETLERPFTFRATRTGEDQKLEFLLYKNREKEPYRSLHLWLDVT